MTYIGARRTKQGVAVNEAIVVKIPIAEFNRFRKEYMRAIVSGALKERTRSDFEAWCKARAAADAVTSQKSDSEVAQTQSAESDAPPVVASLIEAVEGDEPEPDGDEE
jgi:hypothetical protein